MKRAFAVISILLVLVFTASCASVGLPSASTPWVGSTVYFGEWDTTAGMQPILWRVLSNDGGKLLLISDQIIDAQSFAIGGASFKDSAIHAWLNIIFYARAFSVAEQAAIAGTEGDKVSLLSREDALNTSYFADDAARAATATLFAQAHGCVDNDWWLSTEPSPNDAKAEYVGGDGAINEPGRAKFDVSGVRPVISIDLSAISLVTASAIASTFIGSSDGVMGVTGSAAAPLTLAVHDASLPTLTVSGCTLDDSGLTVSCTPSAPLAGMQEVFCMLVSKDGERDYIGWSSLTDGKLHFSKFDAGGRYYALLSVVQVGDDNHSSYSGTAARIDTVDALGITGIGDGDTVDTGEDISFTAVGWGLSNTDPAADDMRWVPMSWSVNGGPSGTWTTAPYTATFSVASAGTQTLTVQYRLQIFSAGDGWINSEDVHDSRSVQFNTQAALTLKMSPADGKIYKGGRVTITPSIAGGAWSFDTAYLKRSGNEFTGLKAGTVRVTYTLGNRTAQADVTVLQASLPGTGQDFTPVYLVLGAAALLAASAAVAAVATRRKKKE